MALGTLLKTPDWQLRANSPLIKARDYAALVEANMLIQHLEREAERAREQAAQELIEARHQGYEKGLELAKAEMAQKIVEISAQASVTFASVQTKIVSTVMNVVQAVLSDIEPHTYYRKVLSRVSRVIRQEPFVTLRVAVDNVNVARQAIKEFTTEAGVTGFIEIRADPTLHGISCIIESESGVIEANLESQLQSVRAALTKSLLPQKDNPADSTPIAPVPGSHA
jgi:type III secretion protein L